MERRTVLRAAAAVAAPWLVRARAQTRARRIGVLYPQAAFPFGSLADAADAWKRRGWIEGETLLVERRYAGWRMGRMPELADELLRQRSVELLMAYGPEAAAAAARLTRKVPIVFLWAYLPIECGLIDSYHRPGRNCTGIALNAGLEVVMKRIEFLRAIAPSARRIALISSDQSQLTLSGAPLDVWPTMTAAAQAQGFESTIHTVHRTEEVDPTLAEAAAASAQVALISGSTLVGAASRVAEFALRQRWATATLSWELFDAGLLLFHGPTDADGSNYNNDRWGQLADRILRGADPAEIPVEMPTRFALVLNLKTARGLGLSLPQSLLLRADRVIE
ncbi:MAG TPA: ABC transporter substrate-binding protein [Burkholderiaceae bacterium]|nr:ABC transporter substrate-binding protein [Burkholderiaceae bacterium]